MRWVVVISGALFCAVVDAGPVFKCRGADGHVVFTQQACGDSSAGEPVRIIPGSGGLDMGRQRPDLDIEQDSGDAEAGADGYQGIRPDLTVRETSGIRIIGTGGSPATRCGPADATEIRTAIVKRQVFVGMSAADAIKSWGKPSKINGSSRGRAQWVYRTSDISAQYLYVEGGCVVAWN